MSVTVEELLDKSKKCHMMAEQLRAEAAAVLERGQPTDIGECARLLATVIKLESKSRDYLETAALQQPGLREKLIADAARRSP